MVRFAAGWARDRRSIAPASRLGPWLAAAIATLLCLAASCGGEAPSDERRDASAAGNGGAADGGAEAGRGGPEDLDSDQDGLCDSSEQAAQTDPEQPDTDGDGIPDVNELGTLFDPLDPESPGQDRMLFLAEEAGASVEIQASVWVEGGGESFTGALLAGGAPAAGGLTAADLDPEVRAVSASPEDQAFDIQPEAARFGIVQGTTELTFSIRFAFVGQEPAGCVRGLPFAFGVKRPDVDSPAHNLFYLLVVGPVAAQAGADAWCKPERCY